MRSVRMGTRGRTFEGCPPRVPTPDADGLNEMTLGPSLRIAIEAGVEEQFAYNISDFYASRISFGSALMARAAFC